MKRRVLEINKADPTAVFSLYVDDLRCRLGYDWFVAQGIDSARVKVSLLSDGTATYNNFYNYFGDPATAQQNWETYAAEVEALDWNHGGRYPETRAEFELESWTWPYYLATRPGYRLVMQNGALLESSCPFITDKLREMQIEDIQPYEMLSALSESARRLFYDMAGFDYDKFAALFDASPKGNLIIIGTSHQNAASEQQQRDYVARIVGQYGAAYDIFFKPHPADTSSASYETDFPGLTLLPGQMPFEIFVWSLMDHVDMIGGYPSTVFLTVPVDKVRFIFAPDAESLVRPLNLLFRDAANVEWMQSRLFCGCGSCGYGNSRSCDRLFCLRACCLPFSGLVPFVLVVRPLRSRRQLTARRPATRESRPRSFWPSRRGRGAPARRCRARPLRRP